MGLSKSARQCRISKYAYWLICVGGLADRQVAREVTNERMPEVKVELRFAYWHLRIIRSGSQGWVPWPPAEPALAG
jgi:hypothetical protein